MKTLHPSQIIINHDPRQMIEYHPEADSEANASLFAMNEQGLSPVLVAKVDLDFGHLPLTLLVSAGDVASFS